MLISTDTILVDKAIGCQIRYWRLRRGLNQAELAQQLGLSAQQLQKYGVGSNRVSASRLVVIADIFGVPLLGFIPENREEALNPAKGHKSDIRMMSHYEAIKDERLRRLVRDIAEPSLRLLRKDHSYRDSEIAR